MLIDLGFSVEEATDGRAALLRLASGSEPDLVLVDWNMPEMNGIDFVEQMRRPPYSSVAKVVMVTTETGMTQMVQALEAGADEYIMKPFTRDAVVEKLQLLGMAPPSSRSS